MIRRKLIQQYNIVIQNSLNYSNIIQYNTIYHKR